MTHRTLRTIAISGPLLATLAVAGCAVPQNAQQAMVGARAAYLSATGLFTVYAQQPWCGPPPAPEPPLCADRQVVIEGANRAAEVAAALNAADAVIAAKGVPSMDLITTLLTQFSAFVTKARTGQ